MGRFTNNDLSDKNLTIEEKINDIKNKLPNDNVEISPDDIKQLRIFMEENNLNSEEDLIDYLYENIDDSFYSDYIQNSQDLVHKVNWDKLEHARNCVELCIMAVTFFSGGMEALDSLSNTQNQTSYVQESQSFQEMLCDFEQNRLTINSDNGEIIITSEVSDDKYIVCENFTNSSNDLSNENQIQEHEILNDNVEIENNFNEQEMEEITISDNSSLDESETFIESNSENIEDDESSSFVEQVMTFLGGGATEIADGVEEDYLAEQYCSGQSKDDILNDLNRNNDDENGSSGPTDYDEKLLPAKIPGEDYTPASSDSGVDSLIENNDNDNLNGSSYDYDEKLLPAKIPGEDYTPASSDSCDESLIENNDKENLNGSSYDYDEKLLPAKIPGEDYTSISSDSNPDSLSENNETVIIEQQNDIEQESNIAEESNTEQESDV